jgi:hypothetical protein
MGAILEELKDAPRSPKGVMARMRNGTYCIVHFSSSVRRKVRSTFQGILRWMLKIPLSPYFLYLAIF